MARFGYAQRVGKRANQEDCIGWSPGGGVAGGAMPRLVVVADGMGGHAAGEIASRLAVDAFVKAYSRERPGARELLSEALEEANAAIARHVEANPNTEGMGCTLVAVEMSDDGASYRWISVGDSPLYLVSNGRTEQVNEDHSFRDQIRRLVDQGADPSELPGANVLRSALMGGHVPLVDDTGVWRPLGQGETLVVATDGIETLDREEIAAAVKSGADAQTLADALADRVEAVGRPRQDNTSIAVIVGALAARSAAAPAGGGKETGASGRAVGSRSMIWATVLGLAALALVAGGGAWLWFGREDDDPRPASASAPASTPAPVPTTAAAEKVLPDTIVEVPDSDRASDAHNTTNADPSTAAGSAASAPGQENANRSPTGGTPSPAVTAGINLLGPEADPDDTSAATPPTPAESPARASGEHQSSDEVPSP